MATQYSDIYIDGIITEELYADGGQIVEAWLNGECIWKLIDKLEYLRHIFAWTKYNGVNYGFGRYAMSNDSNPQYTYVCFYGANVENMIFSECPLGVIGDGRTISAYDFGICVFPSDAVGAIFFDINCTGTLNIKDFPEKLKSVTEFLGEKFVNIMHPLGASCHVFNHKYHIFSRDYKTGIHTTGAAVIRDVKNSTEKIIAFSSPIQNDYFALGSCACFKDKIYFPGEKISHYQYDVTSFLPLFYINENEELSYLELDAPYYTFAHIGGIDANKLRMVWTFHTCYMTPSEYIDNTYLYEYDGIGSKYNLIYNTRNVCGVKIVGQYIVMYGATIGSVNGHITNYSIYAGKKIDNIKGFIFTSSNYGLDYGSLNSTGNSAKPRVFYEENGELFFDIIFTEPKYNSIIYIGNSIVIKMKLNFDTGKIDEISRTEINGTWEE